MNMDVLHSGALNRSRSSAPRLASMNVTRENATLIARSGPGGTPVSEFLLVPFGLVQVERALAGGPFMFTREHAQAALAWFSRQGRPLAIDYEHQTLGKYNAHPEGLAPAAGWIGKLAMRGDGLWATQVEWTAKARALLSAGEYRYLSPVIYWNDMQYRELTGLGPVALTNDPAMRPMRSLAAGKGEPMLATILKAAPVPLIGKAGPQPGGEGADEEPQFSPEDEARIREAAMLLDAAVEKIAQMVNFHNLSLGEVDRLYEHLTKGDLVDLRLLVDGLGQAQKRHTGAAFYEEIKRQTAGSHGGHDRTAIVLGRKWAGDFAGSVELQREFGDVETYVAFKRHEQAGHVRIIGARAVKPAAPARVPTAGRSPGLAVTALKQLYEATPALQREFGDLETFLAFKKHEQAGHVQILHRKQA